MFFATIIINITISSCKKLISVGAPEDQLTAETVFSSDLSAISAMAGLYSQMMQTNLLFASNALTVYPGMSSDEFYNTTTGTNDEFSHNSLSVSNTVVQNNLWSFAYKYIYQANAIIEGLRKSTAVTKATTDQLIGETKLVRAFCHFYLLNLFGGVPLITSIDFRINASLPRATAAEVYDQIIKDLQDAQVILTNNYPTTNRTRPNKWVAKTLLSRVYLYLKDYEKAENLATEVIQSGSYSIVPNLSNVFVSNSNETIWQLAPVQPNYNTWEGNLFITNAGIVPAYGITTSLLNTFESNDGRKITWIKSTIVNGVTYYYPFKYKIKTSATLTEYYIVFRLAELYLIRAEARANREDIQAAKTDLNIIRIRAGLPNTTATTKQTLLFTIEKERQVELFAEWGHRWFDLKRTGRADTVLSVVKPNNWHPTDILYPIPLIEIQRNPALTQNQGY